MATRKKPMWATNLDTGESVNTNPLKPNDCEPWTASDAKKAQVLLSRKFPDKKAEDVISMVELLQKEIGQDWDSIMDAVTQFLKL